MLQCVQDEILPLASQRTEVLVWHPRKQLVDAFDDHDEALTVLIVNMKN